MKNITKLFIAGALMMPTLVSSQVNVSTMPENRNAVIEEWTGIHCGYCPTGHAAVQQAIDDNPGDVVGINVHSGGYAAPSPGEPDYRTPEGDLHDAGFNAAYPADFTGYPASTLNRRIIGGEGIYHPAGSNDADKVPTVLGEPSEVNMHITTTIDITTRQLDVNVEYYYTSSAPSATNYMYVAILQNNVHGPQTTYGGGTYNPNGWVDYPAGIYNHMHVFRGFMSQQWGDVITNTNAGSTAEMTYSMTLPMDINGVPIDLSNIEIAAYINDGFETAGNVLTGLSEYPTLTGFTSTDEVIFSSAAAEDIETCDIAGNQTISPTATIQNWGSSPMTSATITYDVNGGTSETQNWSGNLAPGSSETVNLNAISFTPIAGTNTLNVTVSNPNGVADNAADNSGSSTFQVDGAALTGYEITVNFFTDNYPSETSWKILNSSGGVVVSGGPYTPGTDDQWGGGGPDANTTKTSTHTLPNSIDCYSIRLEDDYGDGQQYGTGQNPSGGFGIQIVSYGNEIVNFDGGSGWTSIDRGAAMRADASSGINDNDFEEVYIFPNPASELLNINFNVDGEATVSIMDLQGRVLDTKIGSNVVFSVSDYAKGSYLVSITSGNSVYTESVVIK